MWKKIGLIVLIVLAFLGVFYRELLSYGWMQAKGQLTILMNVEDVEDVLKSNELPDSLKARIRLIEEIKQYGIDSLGLNPSNNYTTFYNQHGKPILWVLTASEKYKIKASEWHFPIIGTFPYKGFFDSLRVQKEEKELIKEGFDTQINEVSAWSTLGYLKDPILSSMLARSEGSLANLILHELTHGTLFVKSNLELNENLASFIGDQGAIRFLSYKYGADSPQLKKYEFGKKYNDAYSKHVLGGVKQLDSLYATFSESLPMKVKDSLKNEAIKRIITSADTLLGGKLTFSKKSKQGKTELPNNAYFIGYQTYKSRQDIFTKEFSEKFNNDFKAYFKYLKQKYPSL
jgi:predicted aminopeptidase